MLVKLYLLWIYPTFASPSHPSARALVKTLVLCWWAYPLARRADGITVRSSATVVPTRVQLVTNGFPNSYSGVVASTDIHPHREVSRHGLRRVSNLKKKSRLRFSCLRARGGRREQPTSALHRCDTTALSARKTFTAFFFIYPFAPETADSEFLCFDRRTDVIVECFFFFPNFIPPKKIISLFSSMLASPATHPSREAHRCFRSVMYTKDENIQRAADIELDP